MFHRVTDASKAALAYGCACFSRWNYGLIDCQVYTEHLASLGAEEIPRKAFIELLKTYCGQAASERAWKISDFPR
jgi:leucyl/phenylalanyl-tRNA--protein transferase